MENPTDKKFTVVFYETEKGNSPANDFILSLDQKTKVHIARLLDVLECEGNNLREPFSKPIKDGIFELRYQSKNKPVRIMYFFYHDGQIILTNGFIKKTAKAPRREIKRAQRYKKDFIERHKSC